MHCRVLICSLLSLSLALLIRAPVAAEESKNDLLYIYNPSFHGSLLYDRNGGIIGILLNGAQISEDMIITEKSDESERVCVKFPGVLAFAWIDHSHLVENEAEVLDSCLLTGICNNVEKDRRQLYLTPAHPYYTPSDVYLNRGDRVTIAGRYGSYYYLPDNPPYWCRITDLWMRSNMTPSAKYRNYKSDLLSYRELAGLKMEPDGSERFTAETALEKSRECVEQFYSISLEGVQGGCYLNATHVYGIIGKTWWFYFGNYEDELYYSGELIDNTGELYYLVQGTDEFNAVIYDGYPVE